MEAQLSKVSFVPKSSGCNGFLWFDLVFTNRSGSELVTDITVSDFLVSDDLGQTYSDLYVEYYWFGAALNYRSVEEWGWGIRTMAAGETVSRSFCVPGKLDPQVKQIIFTIRKAGRIQNAVWVIDVPR